MIDSLSQRPFYTFPTIYIISSCENNFIAYKTKRTERKYRRFALKHRSTTSLRDIFMRHTCTLLHRFITVLTLHHITNRYFVRHITFVIHVYKRSKKVFKIINFPWKHIRILLRKSERVYKHEDILKIDTYWEMLKDYNNNRPIA